MACTYNICTILHTAIVWALYNQPHTPKLTLCTIGSPTSYHLNVACLSPHAKCTHNARPCNLDAHSLCVHCMTHSTQSLYIAPCMPHVLIVWSLRVHHVLIVRSSAHSLYAAKSHFLLITTTTDMTLQSTCLLLSKIYLETYMALIQNRQINNNNTYSTRG